ncbi:MAG: toprim domain-containing protein [Burkholderiaceae bacterium]|nr:toprim domain-containing protein [Burkholderiaceae bacterium]
MSAATSRGPCPQCQRGPKDDALATTRDERGTVSYCHRCGYTSADNVLLFRIVPSRTTRPAEPLDWSTKAETIWRRTQGLRGTLGETYLLHRGCALPPRDSHLRYLPPDDQHPPTLCAAVSDIRTGKPISLHFTRLAADGRGKAGTDRDKLLLGGHRKRGGCIRLWPDECVTTGLALAEGIESALAAAHVFTPIWATVDAGNMAAFAVLPGVESITIFADHDAVGLRSAQDCGMRWRAAGRKVRVRVPRAPGLDVADLAAEART